MPNDKQAKVIEQLEKALEAGREAKVNGAIAVQVKLHEGGIRDAQVMIQKQIV